MICLQGTAPNFQSNSLFCGKPPLALRLDNATPFRAEVSLKQSALPIDLEQTSPPLPWEGAENPEFLP